MVKKITFLAKIIVIFFCTAIISNAFDLKIIPIKKPELGKETKKEKISKSIIKPKQKPVNKTEVKEIIKTQKNESLIPKSKPIIVKKITLRMLIFFIIMIIYFFKLCYKDLCSKDQMSL